MVRRHLALLIAALVAALVACSSRTEPPVTSQGTTLTSCTYTPAPIGAITGFGVDGQPRQWGSDGRAVKPALDMLVNDMGANFFRVEVNNGETDWETTNDNADPLTFNWAAYDPMFSSPAFQDTWDYIRYLNQLGVQHVELAQHGGLPLWMGTAAQGDPNDGRVYHLDTAQEDEWVETSVAMLVYARTRTAWPQPQFDLFTPFNEPEFSPPEGTKIDPTTQGPRIIRKLVDRINAIHELDGLKIVVSDSASEPGMITFRQAIQNDAVVQARLAATSFHRYSDASVWTTWNNSNPPVWLTEFNSTWLASCYQTTWTMGEQAAGNLISALQSGITAGLAWSDYDAPHIHQSDEWQTFGLLATKSGGLAESQLCGHFNNTQPADSVLDAMTYTPKPTYWALRHAFKFIRPNATRISLTATNVDAVGFENADGTVAIYGRNNGGATNSTVTLTMQGPPSYLTPRISVANNYDQVGTAVPLSNGQGVFGLPAQSVFTLLSSPGQGTGGTGGAGGMGGQSSGGNAGSPAGGNGGQTAGNGGQTSGNGGVSGDSPAGGNGGASGTSTGGQSDAGGASSGASGTSSGGAGQSSGGAGAGGAGAGGAGAGGAGSGGAGQAGSGGTGGNLSKLIAGWAFNEGSGTTTVDASGNGHTGTINGATWVTTGCKFGACLSFTGTGHNVTVPDANSLDLPISFTITAYVKPTTTTGWRPVMLKENAGSTEAYLFYSNPGNQGAYFTDTNATEWHVGPSGNVSTSAWSEVAMVKNGTSLTYWVNGTQLGSAVTVSNLPPTTSNGILAIGGHTFWNGEWYSGLMDDVRIYGAALSASDLAATMSSGL
jgi:hypothetical protein